jgi:exopolyphosphatase/guanosine-5'-triphosphate,3'-diphosphate pyrophosphatase
MPFSAFTPSLDHPVAVVDIGSNSIRLVVYAADTRAPIPVFNEKLLCGLGRDLDRTGKLSEDGIVSALAALPRFIAIADAMGVARIDVVATAAVRDAATGPEFVAEMERRCGLKIQVLSGEEEARLSALGVLSAIPDADGIMGDLGGGSVELVELRDSAPRRFSTLPLGPIRQDLKILAKPIRAQERIDADLGAIDWLSGGKGRAFFAVGGSWRSLARLHLAHANYPLHVIHHYAIPAEEAVDFSRFVSRQSPSSLAKTPGLSRRRVDTLPYAAFLMARLLEATQASELVFCAFGLREGCLFDKLPRNRQAEDPLLTACAQFAVYQTDKVVDGHVLADWMAGAFEGTPEPEARLRRAACLLSDIARFEHPDYRAEHALMRVLRFPFVGVDHPGRAFLAAAVAARHSVVDEGGSAVQTVRYLLDEGAYDRARAVGLAIRVAYTLSGGMTSLLQPFHLERDQNIWS